MASRMGVQSTQACLASSHRSTGEVSGVSWFVSWNPEHLAQLCGRITKVTQESERCQSPLTDRHLSRLSKVVARAHGDLKARRPELAGTLVAGVLAQGAAAHYLDPAARIGVKDLDVWLFYAQRHGIGRVQERGRAAIYDFGPSSLGRHPEDASAFEGRRVDVMTRSIAPPLDTDSADAVRGWLARGAVSPRLLRERPVVMLWPRARCGEIVWPGQPAQA